MSGYQRHYRVEPAPAGWLTRLFGRNLDRGRHLEVDIHMPQANIWAGAPISAAVETLREVATELAARVSATAVMDTIAAEFDGTHGLYTESDEVTHFVETDARFEHGPGDGAVSTLLRVVDADGRLVETFQVTVEATS